MRTESIPDGTQASHSAATAPTNTRKGQSSTYAETVSDTSGHTVTKHQRQTAESSGMEDYNHRITSKATAYTKHSGNALDNLLHIDLSYNEDAISTALRGELNSALGGTSGSSGGTTRSGANAVDETLDVCRPSPSSSSVGRGYDPRLFGGGSRFNSTLQEELTSKETWTIASFRQTGALAGKYSTQFVTAGDNYALLARDINNSEFTVVSEEFFNPKSSGKALDSVWRDLESLENNAIKAAARNATMASYLSKFASVSRVVGSKIVPVAFGAVELAEEPTLKKGFEVTGGVVGGALAGLINLPPAIVEASTIVGLPVSIATEVAVTATGAAVGRLAGERLYNIGDESVTWIKNNF